jgi:hypothetical protein
MYPIHNDYDNGLTNNLLIASAAAGNLEDEPKFTKTFAMHLALHSRGKKAMRAGRQFVMPTLLFSPPSAAREPIRYLECEKCHDAFSNRKKFQKHKQDAHSY